MSCHRLISVRKFGTPFEIPQSFEFGGGRSRSFRQLFREANVPSRHFCDLVLGDARMKLSDGELPGHRIGPHEAEIGHDSDRAFAGQMQTLARIAAVKMTDGSHEIEFFYKGTRRLLQDQHHFAGTAGDFGSATGAGKPRSRYLVI